MSFPTCPFPHKHDLVIIEIFFTHDIDQNNMKGLNRCMGALEAIFLLDITTAGRYLEHLFLIQVAKQLDHATNSHSNNKLNKIGTAEPTSGTTS
jgi:hypothetical protein